MNPRIKELWNEAAESTVNDSWESQTKFIERFAELIVRECAGIYDKIENGNDHLGTDDYLLALKRNFDL